MLVWRYRYDKRRRGSIAAIRRLAAITNMPNQPNGTPGNRQAPCGQPAGAALMGQAAGCLIGGEPSTGFSTI